MAAQDAAASLNFPPPENPPAIRAVKTTAKITLDGSLDEADWQRAQPITDFFRMEPKPLLLLGSRVHNLRRVINILGTNTLVTL